jgi:hypothetical protein
MFQRLDAITGRDLDQLRTRWMQSGKKPSTVNRKMGSISGLTSRALRSERGSRNARDRQGVGSEIEDNAARVPRGLVDAKLIAQTHSKQASAAGTGSISCRIRTIENGVSSK